MPPKTIFTKEQLIDAAFEIANEEGFDSITIRRVAKMLNSSIAPIYANSKDVNELKSEVVKKAIEICKEIFEQQDSRDPFLNIGISSVIFAKRYPLLFDAIALNSNDQYKQQIDPSFALSIMKQDNSLSSFSDYELQILLLKMQAIQSGLAVLAKTKLYDDIISDELIIQILDSTGKDIINGMKHRNKIQGD